VKLEQALAFTARCIVAAALGAGLAFVLFYLL